MKQKIVFKTFILATFSIGFLLQSCIATSTSVRRLEGSEFNQNLPGLWEGNWYLAAGRSGEKRIKIIKIYGNKVDLTGYASGGDHWAATNEVYGRIEDSALLLTWPGGGLNGVNDRFTMMKDDSNNFILNGKWRSSHFYGTSQLKKIE